ncbi:DUF2157 domain-containing protein [Rubrolithibacter danxiaensis]|uniref:DUF2157 domain-containing protein n=1 Tax=Rubrolithibacter danxiaensis TaxID=3390805 RepID=UPI003BF7A360
MRNSTFEDLQAEGLISENTLHTIRQKHANPLFSLYWELKSLLYTGVLLLSSGLGILIYKNIDSISHQAVLIFIAAVSAGCFAWCNKKKAPFSYSKTESPDSFFDYILLLGTLSFLSFVGYLQFQYEVFGNRYGLATFIPMLALFFIAYYFDHIGILTLAIANLAVWMGVTVTPKDLLEKMDFNNERVIYTYLVLGGFLMAAAHATSRYNLKKHFFFTYHHYSVHIIYIALLSGYFYYNYSPSLIWLTLLAIISWFIYMDALKSKSFYFLLLCMVYSYIALSGFIIRTLFMKEAELSIYLSFLYFIGSGIGLARVLINLSKKIKAA